MYMLINVLKSFACNLIPVSNYKYILVIGFQCCLVQVHVPFNNFLTLVILILTSYFRCLISFIASVMKNSSEKLKFSTMKKLKLL